MLEHDKNKKYFWERHSSDLLLRLSWGTAAARLSKTRRKETNDAWTTITTATMAREKKKILPGTPKKMLACMQVPKTKIPEPKYIRSWFFDGEVNHMKWKRNPAY
jgi:hypothetical protein